MPVMSIISCKILQDEILWILENDPSIDDVVVVENENHHEFVEKMNRVSCTYTLLSPEEISRFCESQRGDENHYTLIIELLELALHSRPEVLKNEVYAEVEALSTCSSGILLFYGLCGNVLGDVEKDFESKGFSCPVRILKDDTARVVDDCIGATLGGTENYLKVLKSVSEAGTYLFTPMYSAAWEELLELNKMKMNCSSEKALEMMKLTHEMTGYKRVAKINTGLGYTTDFEARIEEFAGIFGFDILELEGNQELFENCYTRMKMEICC